MNLNKACVYRNAVFSSKIITFPWYEGNYSFESDDGSLVSEPKAQEVRSDKEPEDQWEELWGHQHVYTWGVCACTPCENCPQSMPWPFQILARIEDVNEILRIKRRYTQELCLPTTENTKECTRYAYLGPCPGFFPLFYHGLSRSPHSATMWTQHRHAPWFYHLASAPDTHLSALSPSI